jgi:hydrogenase nickel incorporation protein HypA/HybF
MTCTNSPSPVLYWTRFERKLGCVPPCGSLRLACASGTWRAWTPDALSFCFEALTKETDLESVVLEIERKPRGQRCPRCAHEFVVVNYETACPECGEESTVFLGGDELELAYLELEDL